MDDAIDAEESETSALYLFCFAPLVWSKPLLDY